jgi:hypothetical protein
VVPEIVAPKPLIQQERHILMIDGAYLEIGVKDLCQKYQSTFSFLKRKNIRLIIGLIEKLVNHPFNKIFYVTSEDTDTYARKEKLYNEL